MLHFSGKSHRGGAIRPRLFRAALLLRPASPIGQKADGAGRLSFGPSTARFLFARQKKMGGGALFFSREKYDTLLIQPERAEKEAL